MNELEKYALTDLIQIEISKEKINSYADDVGFPTSKNLILVFRTGVLRIYFPHPNYNCDPDVDPNSDVKYYYSFFLSLYEWNSF